MRRSASLDGFGSRARRCRRSVAILAAVREEGEIDMEPDDSVVAILIDAKSVEAGGKI
jgi:hypothetical protein